MTPPEHHHFESQPRSSPAFLGNWGRRWKNLGLQAESAAEVMFLLVVSLFKGRLGDVRDLTGARQGMLFEKKLCLLEVQLSEKPVQSCSHITWDEHSHTLYKGP